ncbi:cupin domain-containing protein [uncultured Mucilaginibacter sp.]|uniref:cupin domain-containing protein n=1 Tax=uncultured Mucilaginibacter sp. TaxID=797541 RepID=UPI00261DE500|nr:cupin domain-containing protein [uncultured Mucilaginibacter sp.]
MPNQETMPMPQAAAPPQPIDGKRGASILGPTNPAREAQDRDLLAAPITDKGTVANLRWSFADSHNHLEQGGWGRQTTIRELPAATTIAGVNMRLTPGGAREMHWHTSAEWAYMIAGQARITAIDENGCTFQDDVKTGDLWNFPAGIPHSIQGLEPEGCEFLLVFDDGNFTEEGTFLLTDWLIHTPKSVLAKNFGVSESVFDSLPAKPWWIFQAPVPGTLESDRIAGAGPVPASFSFHMEGQEPIRTQGGSVRIVDSKNFPASTTIAAAIVEVEPGGMREMHWHPNAQEWQFYLEGQARMTVFAADGSARTFDYQAGDVGCVPFPMGHYVENTGTTTLRFLECFRSDHYADVSLRQWLAFSPAELVKAHLGFDTSALAPVQTYKTPVVPA